LKDEGRMLGWLEGRQNMRTKELTRRCAVRQRTEGLRLSGSDARMLKSLHGWLERAEDRRQMVRCLDGWRFKGLHGWRKRTVNSRQIRS